MTTMNVLDSAGSTVAVEKPLAPGQAAMAASRPVVLASDQSSIPVAATLAAETTKVIGTVRTASGGVAAGSLAAGAGVDGWDLTQGAIADAAVTAGASGSISAKLRSISRDIVANIVLAAGTNIIGLFKLSDGTNTAAVKGASTAPLATDPALVVAISPNSVNANGSTTDSASAPVAFSTEGKAQLGSLTETAPASDTASSGINGRLQRIAQRLTSLIGLLPTALGSAGGVKVDDIFSQYETVAASQTAQAMGATGATGDYLAGVLVFPGTSGCGVVTILDNATTIGTFAGGGTTALADLKPFMVPVGLYSTSGAWKITTGANVTAVGIGKFT